MRQPTKAKASLGLPAVLRRLPADVGLHSHRPSGAYSGLPQAQIEEQTCFWREGRQSLGACRPSSPRLMSGDRKLLRSRMLSWRIDGSDNVRQGQVGTASRSRTRPGRPS
jgi:hypothetical protein